MSLDVYLKGKRVGTLHPGEGCDYSFAYLPEVVEGAGAGTPLLSYALPVQSEPYGPADIRPYVEGLLPEGERREQIARELGIHDPEDGYSLIAALGGDCPGAVVFLSEGSVPESRAADSLTWLDEDDLEELVGEEPEWLVDPNDERRMRFALPGRRHKLALVHDEEEDRWAWPEPGMASTHIVKPQPEGQDGLAFNEMVCSMAFREMGLPAAHAEVRTIAGRPCFVSKRFDRWSNGAVVERMHQESFRQALGYSPLGPDQGGPGYAESRELLKAIGEEEGVEGLFTASYSRFLIGDEEHHGENSALLYTDAGPLLAPFHDIAAGAAYDEVATPENLDEFIRQNSCVVGLTPIAIECGYEPQPAFELSAVVKMKLCQAFGAVAERARDEGWYEPIIDQLLTRVVDRFKAFRAELKMLEPPPPENS